MPVKRIMIYCLGFSLLLTACMSGNKPPANQAAQQPKHANHTQRVQQTAPEPAYNQSSQATADRLAQLATRVKRVHSATAVVLGKYAVVGITVDPNLDRPEVGVIKYTVAEALKEDPQGANAVVTADPAIVQRLREMRDDIRRGHPVAGITEELADIVGRIIPQLPRSVQPREETPSQVKEKRMHKEPQGQNKINANRTGSP
ncbi:YhcN/YlaJ family sporulation lipoprotein [Brevibacillus sp. M2.1A]|uniref:YhcN/YlaJ family sporulation lipoprotein n=1 Tax=Brevibacillus TaxID=55080 RepID=UPI00156B6315|nr:MULTISPECIES: YhcN/YlaJ family sporulation lipoprotein [Brevibacillus]MBY0088566.1 YhcN/YlaJ family sporulation lipoprotein [Brevibacillus brevis]MCC8437206.1 YhcN/YlaJ family sporulation lipoprotein [Brevibacillus sp. M2.1A]MCE0449796.1 YhcN/YlaJ family sporulation lipoprotein [Brevibacillus sp. AF8]UKK99356.1 YhcN/YlaJ family sporulation lipoprotein [Brevibacillus brevis]